MFFKKLLYIIKLNKKNLKLKFFLIINYKKNYL